MPQMTYPFPNNPDAMIDPWRPDYSFLETYAESLLGLDVTGIHSIDYKDNAPFEFTVDYTVPLDTTIQDPGGTWGGDATVIGGIVDIVTGGNDIMPDAPYVDFDWSALLPGGDPFLLPQGQGSLPGGLQIRKKWSTGTTTFAIDANGGNWVWTKNGWKKYRKKKPIVLGTKNLTPKKLMMANKRYKKLYNALGKIPGFKSRRR